MKEERQHEGLKLSNRRNDNDLSEEMRLLYYWDGRMGWMDGLMDLKFVKVFFFWCHCCKDNRINLPPFLQVEITNNRHEQTAYSFI